MKLGLAGMRKALVAAALLAAATSAHADCVDDAAQYHKVNPWILRAIAARESNFNPTAIGRNSNNTEDLGMFGTNTVHLPELARYGIDRKDLFDSCKAAYVASWRLAKMVRKYGNTWEAAGAYHSETPFYRDHYAARIRRLIEYWKSIGLLRSQ